MHNWSTDTKELKKDKKKYSIWKLEQMVNFGLDGKKISTKELKTHWKDLRLDPHKRNFLSFLLWGKAS